MILAKYEKQPSEVKDYSIDYSPWLLSTNDAIDSVTVGVKCLTSATNTAMLVDSVENTSSTVKVWLSGGDDGFDYKVTVQITTNGGRVDESELIFRVRDR